MNRGARSVVLVTGWLTATPALASDPTGIISFMYAFLVALPWAAIMLVTTAVRAKRGAYDKSVAAARSQAVIGAAVPLAGLAVVAYDFFAIRRPSTPWPGIETVLISAGICLLAALAGLAPLVVSLAKRSGPTG